MLRASARRPSTSIVTSAVYGRSPATTCAAGRAWRPDGFVIRADPQGWLAIFGFYTPSLRTPELIPGQVRLLRSLLTDGIIAGVGFQPSWRSWRRSRPFSSSIAM